MPLVTSTLKKFYSLEIVQNRNANSSYLANANVSHLGLGSGLTLPHPKITVFFNGVNPLGTVQNRVPHCAYTMLYCA